MISYPIVSSCKMEDKFHPKIAPYELTKRLKEHIALSKVNHKMEVMKLTTLKEVHTYCVYYGISGQKYGPLIESFIRIKFNYTKNKSKHCNGDCSKEGKNTEIKASLGGDTHTKFNFVQLRPLHDCDTYIFTAYHLSFENVESNGELYIFKVPKEEIKKMIVSYGGYAHGTIKEHGIISLDSIQEACNREYALRPTLHDKCWNALLSFRVSECDL